MYLRWHLKRAGELMPSDALQAPLGLPGHARRPRRAEVPSPLAGAGSRRRRRLGPWAIATFLFGDLFVGRPVRASSTPPP